MLRVNGRSIKDYRDFDTRETGLAVPKAEPSILPVQQNGISFYDFVVDDSLLFCMLPTKVKGTTFKSVDRYKHTCTGAGILWRPNHYYFDGSDDQIVITKNDCFNVSAGFTVDLFLYPANMVGDHVIITKINVGNNYPFTIKTSGANLQYNAYVSGVQIFTISAGGVTASTWNHIAATYDSSLATQNAKLYINGSKVGNANDQTGLAIIDTNIYIGAFNLIQPYKGRIGALRIYNRALSAAEIAHNRAAGLGVY